MSAQETLARQGWGDAKNRSAGTRNAAPFDMYGPSREVAA